MSQQSVSVLLRAVDSITEPTRRARASLGRFQRQARMLSRRVGFDHLATGLVQARAAAGDLTRTVARLGRRLVTIGSLGAAALGGITMSTANAGDEVSNFAQQLGMTTQEVQEWRFAAQRLGVDTQTLNSALESFARRLGEARDGEGQLYNNLRDTNPQLLQQITAADSMSEALRTYMTALEQAEDRQRANALAAHAFSQSGQELVRMVQDGAGEIDRLKRRAHEFGHVMDEDAIEASIRFQDRMDDMRATMTGVRNTIGGALMPTLSELMGRLSGLVVGMQPQIREWAQGFAEDLPDHLANLRDQFVQLRERLGPLADAAGEVVDRFGAVNTAAAGLALMLGGPLLRPVLRLGGAMVTLSVGLGKVTAALTMAAVRAVPLLIGGLKALGVAVRAHPLGAFITMVAGAAALIMRQWGPISEFFRGIWDGIVAGLEPVIDQVRSFASTVQEWIEPLAPVFRPIGRAVAWVGEQVGEFIDWLRGLFGPIDHTEAQLEATRSAGERVGEVIGTTLANAFDMLTAPIRAAVDAIEWIWGKISDLGDWLGGLDWGEIGKRLIQSFVDGIKRTATAPARALESVVESARELLPFSDARRGPLSDLTRAGQAIPQTLAAGVEGSRDELAGAVRRATDQASHSMHAPAAGGEAGAAGAQGEGPSLATRSGVHIERIEMRPTINVQAGAQDSPQDVAQEVERQLRQWRDRQMWSRLQSIGGL